MRTQSPVQVPASAAELTRIIRSRRSVKPAEFSGELVSREEIELLLSNAHWAPNHGKTEPWWFVVFQGDGKDRFGQAHADLYRAHTPEESYKQLKYDKLIKLADLSACVIALCMKRGNKDKIPVIEEVQALATAVQNLHLTATAMGLAGYWSSGGMTYHPGMHEFLELGEQDQCLGFFMLGRPKEAPPEGKRFADWTEKVRWVDS